MTQTSLSAARSTRRGEKLPMLMQRCAATGHAVAGRIQWRRHSCLCAFIEPSIQRVAHRVTSQPVQFLIANLELKLHSTHRKTSPLKISNRKYSSIFRRSDQDRRPERTKRVEGRSFLIHGSAIKTPANPHRFNHIQISNRRRSDQDRRPERTKRVEGRSFLIHGSAIKTPANQHRFNHMQISNRWQTGGKPTRLFALELSDCW